MLFCDSDRGGYTIELGKIDRTEGMEVFDFPYRFYDEEFKCDFERKFIDHYYFDEIGFETIGRFKHHLKSRLNLRMPYYEQLYKTELAAEGIDFLLNKDLTETTIRELITEDKMAGSDSRTSMDSRNVNGTDIIQRTGENSITHEKASKTQFDSSDKTTNELKDIKGGKNTTTNEEGTKTTNKELGTVHRDINETTTIDQTTTNQGSSSDNKQVSNVNDGVSSASLNERFLTGVEGNSGSSNNNEKINANNLVSTGDDTQTDIKNEGTEDKTSKVIETLGETLEKTGTVKYEKRDITLTSGADTDKEKINNRDTAVKEQTVKDQGSTVGENKEDRNGKEQEKTEFVSRGNIGVVSPAELLEKWRRIILNLDEMIILDCRDLFMGIF